MLVKTTETPKIVDINLIELNVELQQFFRRPYLSNGRACLSSVCSSVRLSRMYCG